MNELNSDLKSIKKGQALDTILFFVFFIAVGILWMTKVVGNYLHIMGILGAVFTITAAVSIWYRKKTSWRWKGASKKGVLSTVYTVVIAIYIMVPCLALWLVELKYGNGSPFIFQQGGTASTLSTTITVICWIALFCWIWVFNGANSLARIYPLASYKLGIYAKPITYKVIVILVLAAGVFSMTVQKDMFSDLQINSNKAGIETP